MKKVIFIARDFKEHGGSYSGFIEEMSKYCSEQGYNVKILCGNKGNQKEREFLEYAEIVRFKLPKTSIPGIGMNLEYIALGSQIRAYFKTKPPTQEDILLANGRAALGVLNRSYILRTGQPAMTFLKNMEIAKDKVSMITRIARAIHFYFQSYLERKCARCAKAIIAPSYETKRLVEKDYNLSLPYFVPQSGILFDNFQKGKLLPIKGRKMLLVASGGEKIRKGIVYLEAVLPEIFENYKDVKLINTGNNLSLNVPDKYRSRIISPGKVDWMDMKNYYATADFMISPALNEGIPNAILECMAAGTPVLTSDINGIREYIRHLETGYVFERGNTSELREGIIFLLENKRKRLKMGKLARERIRKIDYSIYSKSLLTFMEDLKLNKRPEINLLKR